MEIAPVGRQMIVIYDDDCGLCSELVRRIRPAIERTVSFLPAQLCEGELRKRGENAVIVVEASGITEGPAAIARMATRCGPYGLVLATLLSHWPGTVLAPPIYRLVAKNRARISGYLGLKAGCAIPAQTNT